MSDFTRPRDVDREIDEALDAATRNKTGPQEISFKRQWDEELDRELQAAMEGFDPDELDVAKRGARTRSSDRAHVPKGSVGQEASPGMRKGKVVAVRGKSVFVDMGSKSEGVVPTEQFGDALPNVGDMIDVRVDRFDRDEGLLILSLKGAAVEANWENLKKGLIVEARVTKTNKGGLDVEVDGIRGFMPIGQIDLARVEDAAVYVNQKLRAIVTEANPREKNLVVSRKELLLQERAEMQEKTWAELEEGQTRHGVVRSVQTFGAFVDIGGVDGLIHISDLSWSRLKDAGDAVKIGQEVDVKVLKLDRTTRKVGLGLKQLTASPWDLARDKYARGMTVQGKVTRLMDFGAFVELEPGIEGLIHITELSPNRVRRVSDIVKPDQDVEVRIVALDVDNKKIGLSLKPLPKVEEVVEEAEPEVVEEEAPKAPKPERKVPLKGGLGGGGPLFGPKS